MIYGHCRKCRLCCCRVREGGVSESCASVCCFLTPCATPLPTSFVSSERSTNARAMRARGRVCRRRPSASPRVRSPEHRWGVSFPGTCPLGGERCALVSLLYTPSSTRLCLSFARSRALTVEICLRATRFSGVPVCVAVCSRSGAPPGRQLSECLRDGGLSFARSQGFEPTLAERNAVGWWSNRRVAAPSECLTDTKHGDGH